MFLGESEIREKKATITSALPYVHGIPHLGNIVGSMLPADILHRYLDLKGVDNIYICGSDVHGTPLELEAIKREMDVEELKEQQHKKTKEVLKKFGMDFSIFSDTDTEYNKKQTHEMFIELYSNGYIKEKTEKLPFSPEDNRFLPDRYIEGECPECGGLARGDQCDDCGKLLEPEEIVEPYSTISGSKEIEFRETKHLFLDLKPFKKKLKDWLNSKPQPVPESIIKQVENDIENAESRSITRDQKWGFNIPVEKVNKKIEDENLDLPKLDTETYQNKVLYVWFDAPIGYIGFTRELFKDNEEWEDYWTKEDTDIYYSIGKDNAIFHTVIWPSMLIGASTEDRNYNLPHYEFIHQYLMAEDTKFSKSRGKGLSTEEALEMYPADYWRFYLAKKIPKKHDTKFSWKDFEKEINNVLNDTVGNFVNRTLSLAEKWFDNKVPVADFEKTDEETLNKAEEIVEEYEEKFEKHELKEALEKSLELARLGDKYLSDEEPWKNPERREETIQISLKIIRGLAVTLYPFTPDTSQRIAEMLNTEIHTEEGTDEFIDPLLGGISSGHELGEREILFEKIDVEEKKNKEEKEEDETTDEKTISFEDFMDMDIRIGKVKDVEDHPNADKLYKVKIDVGGRVLQSCAGLKNHYVPEELKGKKVVVLVNLESTELRGEKSECMMLAAEDEDGKVSLLGTDAEISIGSEVR